MNNNYKMTCTICNREANFRVFVYMDEGKLYLQHVCIKCDKGTKRCSRCTKIKPRADFLVKSNTTKDGLSIYCFKCRKVQNAQNYLKRCLVENKI